MELTAAERATLEKLTFRLRTATIVATLYGFLDHAATLAEHVMRCEELLSKTGKRCWS
jgi:hypothetical protein